MNIRLHTRLYRVLMYVLPRGFRHEFGQEMVQAFREDLTRSHSPIRQWLHCIIDLITTASAEWSGTRPVRGSYGSNTRKRFHLMNFSSLFRDLRIGARSLRRSPAFTTLSVLIVTLGVAANATTFSLARSLLWEEPPLVIEPSELVRVTRANTNTQSGALSYPDYVHYRDNNEVFNGLMAYDDDGFAASMANGDNIETVRLGNVSHNYFDVLGVRMALGREFVAEEDLTPGVGAVAVLSHGIWMRSFGGDSSILGRHIALNGTSLEIIGVAPREFVGVSPIETPPDIWAPLNMYGTLQNQGAAMLQRVEGETWRWLNAVGRLRDGTTIESAQGNMSGLASFLAENYTDWNEGQSVHLHHHAGYRPNDFSTALTMTRLLMGVAGLVLLVASANMASMLLARASSRRHEIAIRRALGASGGRIAWQLLAEASLVGLLGSSLGFVVAVLAMRPVVSLLPVSLSMNITPDVPVFLFSVVAGLVTVLLFGTIPAVRTSRTDVQRGARETSRMSFGKNVLVAAQVAASVVVTAGAILFGRSVVNANAVDLGFATDNRLIVSFNLRNHGYASERVAPFITEAIRIVGSLPAVDGVSSTAVVPFQGSWGSSFTVPGISPTGDHESFDSGFNAVGPDYFEVFRVPLLAGRGFTADDNAGNQPVLVVNQTTAKTIWNTEDVVGRIINWRDKAWTVVGVARDGSYYNLGEEPQTQIVAPVLQQPMYGVNLIVTTNREDPGLVTSIENAVHGIDPNVAITGIRPMQDFFLEEIGRYRTAAIMVSAFGFVAVVLAAVGIYGILAFLVAQQSREIGVRMALGASAKRVAREVVVKGIGVAAIGIGIGLLSAIAAARLATAFLFGVRPGDPWTFVAAAGLLGLVAAIASAVPAFRATRVDPMKALRAE